MKAHKANFLIAGIFLLWLLSLLATGYEDKHEPSKPIKHEKNPTCCPCTDSTHR